MLVISILVASLILQIIAVYFVLRLIKVSRKSLPWSLLALAISLMALRSIVTLGLLLTPETVPQSDLTVEVMALTISALMALGIERITPVVAGLQSSAERQRKNIVRYHTIFENSPISILEEDFSEIKARFLRLRREGITDIKAHFNQRPEVLKQFAELVRITDVNRAALTLHRANSKEELLADLVKTFTAELFHTFQEELISLWRGNTEMNRDTVVMTLDGEPRHVTAIYTVCPGHEETLSKVFVSLVDITERKQAEQERQRHENILACMDRVNRAIQNTSDLEFMMRNVLDEVLDIFGCDRAYLLYPCDPDAPSWAVQMESVRPEYPGISELSDNIPMDPEVAAAMELLLNNPCPVKFGPGADHSLPKEVAERFDIKSVMSIALYPKVGKSWQFGLHQCSYERIWKEEEERLLQQIGARLNDALSSLLIQRDLRESEAKYRRIVDTAIEGTLTLDEHERVTFINAHMAEMLGYTVEELQGSQITDFMLENDLANHRQRLINQQQNRAEVYERCLIRKDGSLLWVLVSATPVFDGDLYRGTLAMVTDITTRKQLEEQLAGREREFRTLAENAPINIARYDRDGRLLYFNPKLAANFPLPIEQIIGLRPKEMPGLPMAHFQEALSNTLESGEECSYEIEVPGANGAIETHFISMVPERNESGEMVGILSTGLNITAKKRAEREHQIHSELLANLDRVNRAIQGAIDLETMMHDVLDEVLEIFACDRAFLMHPCDPSAKSWTVPMERTRPEHPGVNALNEEIAMDEEVATTLKLLVNCPGVLKFGPGTDHPLPAEAAQRYGLKSFMSIALYPKLGKAWQFGIHQCSYDRVWTEAEEQLLQEIARRLADGLTSLLMLNDMRENQHRLVEAQHLAHIGNWQLDLTNNALTWSDEILRIFELDIEKSGASYEALLDTIHPDDREMVNAAYTESLKNKQPYDIAHRLLMKDGRIKHVNERCETYFNNAGKPLRSLGTVQDITEQKLREHELNQYRYHLEEEVRQRTKELQLARDAAEMANKAKSVFLANMSHELRTPLNAILGFSHMMQQDSGLNDSQQEILEIINNSGEHLLKLINDVLEIAKIEAGKLQLEKTTYNLHILVREVTDMMRLRAQLKGLKLELEQSSDIPRNISGDEGRLRQILVNLVNNAVKFTDEGVVTIRLGVKTNNRQYLLIEVEDTGPGISEEDQLRLFSPFVQLAESTGQGGTGLGLSIVREFVQLMDGTVVVESTPGKGSLFRVELPLEVAEETGVVRLASENHSLVMGLAPGQPSYRILIAEDQSDNQQLLSKLMTDLGQEVKIAVNGEECVRLFTEWQPELIWMDRKMPVMDGIEATRRIRQLPKGDKVKIIAVTASAFKEQQEELLAAGMDDFVRKPYRFGEIYDSLAKQLDLRYRYKGAAATETEVPAALTHAMFATLPEELHRELLDAVTSLDADRITAVIDRIRMTDAELGRTLSRLAEYFDYPAILRALDDNPQS
jgi:PAS domain S-box-containing protein